MCYNEQWGSVCSDDWDLTDGNVLCQQLGYPKALSVHHLAYYGIGSGPIQMDNVQCEGSEDRLDQCMFKGWGISDCSHDDDAGVACKGEYHYCQCHMLVTNFAVLIILLSF